MSIAGKMIGGISALIGMTGAACLSGWGSQLLGPQTIEEVLIKEGKRPLGANDSEEKWTEKMKLVKKDNPEKSHLRALAENKGNLNEFKLECQRLLQTGRSHETYEENRTIAQKYCSA